jgi:hypothetical protein
MIRINKIAEARLTAARVAIPGAPRTRMWCEHG